MVTSQFFYTVTYIGTLMTVFGSVILKFCCKLSEKRVVRLILILAVILMISSKFNSYIMTVQMCL